MMMKIPPCSPCRSSWERGGKLPISAMYSPICGIIRIVAFILRMPLYDASNRLILPRIGRLQEM